MKCFAVLSIVFKFVQCTSYWVTNFDESRKTADVILREHFNSANDALAVLETAINDKIFNDNGSIIECSYKLIQLMQIDKFPIERSLELLDQLLNLVVDAGGLLEQSRRMLQALHKYRTLMPPTAFDALLQRPALANALRSDPKWRVHYPQITVPVFMSMHRIGCRLGQQDLLDSLADDVRAYWQREFIYDLTLGAQTACSILYIPERLDWATIINQVPESKTRLGAELIDVVAVRQAAERIIDTYLTLFIGTDGLLLPEELFHEIRSYLAMIIGQEFDQIVRKYSCIFVLTLW